MLLFVFFKKILSQNEIPVGILLFLAFNTYGPHAATADILADAKQMQAPHLIYTFQNNFFYYHFSQQSVSSQYEL